MPLENPVNEISDLNANWPENSDLQSFSDDHKRNIKRALQNSFSHMGTNGGVVTVTAAELNRLAGTTSGVQSQINSKSTEWQLFSTSTVDPTGRSKLFIAPPDGGTVVALPSGVTDGTEIRVHPFIPGATTLDPSKPIIVVRSGSDLISNLETGAQGLTALSLVNAYDYWTFVFESRVGFPDEWFAWSLPRSIS